MRKKCKRKGCKVYPRKGQVYCAKHRGKRRERRRAKITNKQFVDELINSPRLIKLGKRLYKKFYK